MSAVVLNRPPRSRIEDVPPGRRGQPHGSLRCLVVGAGAAGRTLARDLRRCPDLGLWPIGFLDDDPHARGAGGLPVLGTTAEIDRLAVIHGADVVLIAIPSLPARSIRRLAETAARSGAAVRFLPSFGAALEREAHMHDLRHLRVNELLGRPETRVVRPQSRAYIEGRRVLVTGAGGSIGSELCRQVRALGPEALFLLDHDESNLQRVQMELTGESLLDSDELLIADVRDGERIRQLFSTHRPQVVFHAAAHKHLPLLERHPSEGVKSNVLGTRLLLEAALEFGSERLILISTDKAADPVSVLGATKRLAEMVLQARTGMGTRLASVRFGNVLGSRGSLLSILAEQMEKGDDITVTDPQVSRYFMTIEEAAGLVVEAGGMAEDAETFVLDMGEPIQVLDLVRNYAMQSHLDPDALPIRYTGLRPGEKLRETLVSHGETILATSHPKINAVAPLPVSPSFSHDLERLLRSAQANRIDEVRQCLGALVPEYEPSLGKTSASLAPALYADDY